MKNNKNKIPLKRTKKQIMHEQKPKIKNSYFKD